jgi:hypothetical protein
MIALGRKVKDKITGFNGIVTAHATYISGSDAYQVTYCGYNLEDRTERWFDEARLEYTDATVLVLK